MFQPRTRTATLAVLAISCWAARLPAQQPDSGRVLVRVQESMGMLGGFRVQSEGRAATTDSAGEARLTLPVGRRVLEVTRRGFNAAKVTVVVLKDSLIRVDVPVRMAPMGGEEDAMEMAAVKVSATRTERLAGETPLRVEVVDEMEVDEKTLMNPSGIGMLLNETPGVRVQPVAPGLGTGGVRILGLPGQYTVMLADGLPLYGGGMSALGPLDISPVDLQRVEIIKGAASSLYGGQSLGGVINLVSKAPTGKKEVLLNRRTLSVTDAATWLSGRLNGATGVSLLASGTLQGTADLDRDGWADQAKARRWNIRPRLTAVDKRGRSLFATAGYGYDNRDGGTLGNARAPDGRPFREGLRSQRADLGSTASVPLRNGTLAARLALATSRRERTFGAGPLERDENTTGFAEVTRSLVREQATLVLGGAMQVDAFANALNNRFDYRWVTPGLFATAEQAVGRFTASASVRGDFPSAFDAQLTQRVALLAKLGEGWSMRGSAGTGYAPPRVMTEETDAVGLRRIQPGMALRPEQSRGAMLDVNGRFAGADVLVTVHASRIRGAIQLRERDSGFGATLQNAGAESRIGGVESVAVWSFRGGKFIGTYGYSHGSRPDAMTGAREAAPMLPRHRVGGDLMLEKPGVYRMGIEGTWFGVQPLDDNPWRSNSKPYTYMMALVARQFGALELVANFENLLNVRQTRTDPLVRTAPMASGRWTTDVWAPLEGFMANVALRYRW